MSDSSSEDVERAFDLVLEVVVLLGEDMTCSLEREGLTQSRAHLLWTLQDGPATQRQLSDALQVTPRTVTGLVDGLVATGFVTREPHPTDRRATLVSYTERGAQAVAALQSGRRALGDSLFGRMPAAAVHELVTGLEHVVGRLRELAPDRPDRS